MPRAVIQRDRSGIKIQISVALWLREFVAGARINKTMAHKLRTIGRGIKEAAAGLVDVPAFSLYFKHLVTNMLDEPPSHRNKEGYMKDDVLVHTYEKKTELRIQPAQRLIAFSTWPGMLRASNRRSEKFQFPLLSGRASGPFPSCRLTTSKMRHCQRRGRFVNPFCVLPACPRRVVRRDPLSAPPACLPASMAACVHACVFLLASQATARSVRPTLSVPFLSFA